MSAGEDCAHPRRFFELVFLDGDIERHAIPVDELSLGPKDEFDAEQIWHLLKQRLHRAVPWRGPRPTVREISSEDYRAPTADLPPADRS